MRIGEVFGFLDFMLDNFVYYYWENIMVLVDNFAVLLELVLLIIMGGIIGMLVVVMYLLIFYLGDVMSGMG